MTQGKTQMTLDLAMTFLATTPKAQSIKEKVDELGYIKIKNFCSAKDNVKRMRRQATDWGKNLQILI